VDDVRCHAFRLTYTASYQSTDSPSLVRVRTQSTTWAYKTDAHAARLSRSLRVTATWIFGGVQRAETPYHRTFLVRRLS